MKELLNEFKAFIMKGNVVDLAVGVIIGGAFGKIVESVVKDVITPIVELITKHTPMALVGDGLGRFGGQVTSFLMLAAIVFFIIVKPMNKLKELAAKKEAQKPAEPAPVPADVALLTEIRDLLKKQA